MAGVDYRLLLPCCLAASRLITQITTCFAVRNTANQAAIRRKLRRVGEHLHTKGIKNNRAQPCQTVKILQQYQKLFFMKHCPHGSASLSEHQASFMILSNTHFVKAMPL